MILNDHFRLYFYKHKYIMLAGSRKVKYNISMDNAYSKEYNMSDGEKQADGKGMGSQERQEKSSVVDAGTSEGDRPKSSAHALGSVYILETEDGSLVKFGYAHRLTMRLTQVEYWARANLRTHVRLIGFFPGTHQTETMLHREFSDCRVYGDWYDRDAVLSRFLIKPVIPPKLKPGDRCIYKEPIKSQLNPAAVALSARRMVKISPKRRKEIAANASRVRWGMKKEKGS